MVILASRPRAVGGLRHAATDRMNGDEARVCVLVGGIDRRRVGWGRLITLATTVSWRLASSVTRRVQWVAYVRRMIRLSA
jgi:hypothetical protein